MATERGQWTIKSRRLDAELQNACRLAAGRQGMAVGDWIAESLRTAALGVLTNDDGTPRGTPPPPVRLEDVRDELLATVERRLGEIVERLAPQAVASQAPGPVFQAEPQGGLQAVPQGAERDARRLRTVLRSRGRR